MALVICWGTPHLAPKFGFCTWIYDNN